MRSHWLNEKGLRFKVNSIVLVKDDNIPPLQGKLGLVQSLHTDTDGIARVATIKTRFGVYRCAVRYLCPLPFEDNTSVRDETRR